jgi:FAD binding domain
MASTDIPPEQIDRLRSRAPELVVMEGDPGWDAGRQAFNLAIDQRPALVALPASVDEVAAVVEFARANGLRVAPQRTGHAAEALGDLGGTVLLRTERLRGVEIDAADRRAWAGAGTLWGEVVDPASAHGLAPIAGSSRGVGVVGYSLGGGLGFLGRKHGLATNSVTAVELITVGGELVRATAEDEPELFWALRGGGGSFGVVTAIEFDLFPAPDVYAGVLLFPFERASEVLHAWREATLTAPEELTLVGRLLQIPDVPGPPPHMRGRGFAAVGAIYLGDEAAGAELLAPLRALGPEIDTVATIEPAGLGAVHMDPEEPVPAHDDHLLTGSLPPEAIDAFVEAVGPGSGSSLVSVEIRQTGGALAREAPGAGALSRLAGDYAVFGVGSLMAPGSAEKVPADLARLTAAMAPYDAGRYFNYSDRPVDASVFHSPQTYAGLQQVRLRWDPDGLIHAGHPVR